MDANQAWDIGEAVANLERLAEFEPHWIEEPTSPDDVLGHATIARAIAPIRVATGEHCQNRVLFKQLFQVGAIGFCQLDCCRLGVSTRCSPSSSWRRSSASPSAHTPAACGSASTCSTWPSSTTSR